MVAGRRNQTFFSFNYFRKPCHASEFVIPASANGSRGFLVADDCGAGEPTHFDVSHRRLTEEALILGVELTRTLIADFERRARGIEPFDEHSFSRGN